MKTLAAILLTFTIVGCTTTHGRFDHRTKAPRVDKQHHRSGDHPNRQIDAEEKRLHGSELVIRREGRKIREAIESGKMTPEEGREKMKELREKLNKRKSRKTSR